MNQATKMPKSIDTYKELLNEEFSIKDLKSALPTCDITYRKINDWDNNGLLTFHRKTEDTGWRIFNVWDTIKIQIIADLKRFGFFAETIKQLIEKIAEFPVVVEPKHKKDDGIPLSLKYLYELATFSSLNGAKPLLVINDKNEICFVADDVALKDYFLTESDVAPVLILPFYLYAQQAIQLFFLKRSMNDEAQEEKVPRDLSAQEKKIIELYRNNDYQEILIKKRNGTETILKPKSHRQGNFTKKDLEDIIEAKAFQKVTVQRLNGKTISITNEETIKV